MILVCGWVTVGGAAAWDAPPPCGGGVETKDVSANETVTALRQQMKTAEAQIGTLTQMLDELRREMKSQDLDSQSLRERAVKLAADNARLRSQLEVLAREREASLNELESVRAAAADAKALAERLAEAQKSSFNKEQQAKTADITAQRMQAQMLEQTRRLKEAQAAVAALERERTNWEKTRRSQEAELRRAKGIPEPREAPASAAVESEIAPVFFATSDAQISEDYLRVLKSMKQILTTSPSTRFTLTGHSSKEGTEETNLRFSAFRAESVAKFLIARGIPDDRLTVVAAGSRQPLFNGANRTEDRKNRRVEITVER